MGWCGWCLEGGDEDEDEEEDDLDGASAAGNDGGFSAVMVHGRVSFSFPLRGVCVWCGGGWVGRVLVL